MVISQKMSENEIDNRGSKAANKAVKEQRVDGSYHLKKLFPQSTGWLRCTLMGFERNYQVKNLSCCGFAAGPAALRRSNQIILV
jgi:hypothetical protein